MLEGFQWRFFEGYFKLMMQGIPWSKFHSDCFVSDGYQEEDLWQHEYNDGDLGLMG